MVTIYHNPRCRKSRETLAILEASKQDINIKEYLKHPPTRVELKEVLEYLQLHPSQLIRKSEAEYKAHFKGKNLSDQEWIDAMITYPKLIERPIVIKNGKAVIGRPPESVKTIL